MGAKIKMKPLPKWKEISPKTSDDQKPEEGNTLPKVLNTDVEQQTNLDDDVQRQGPELEKYDNRTEIADIVRHLGNKLLSVFDNSDNIIFSPFSISVVLGMAYLGASGSTAIQMEQALGYKEILGEAASENLHYLYHTALQKLRSNDLAYKMLLANGLFMQKGLDIHHEYVYQLYKQYSTTVYSMDFSNSPQESLTSMNEWVSRNTEGKISKILDKPIEDPNSLALLNAIYFQGFWKFPFATDALQGRPFYKLNGENKVIPFMVVEKKFRHFSDDKLGCDFLRIFYKKQVYMLIILPKNRSALPNIAITAEMLEKTARGKKKNVQVILPKFKLEYQRELSNDLAQIGVTELFSKSKANLSGMSPNNNLYFSMMVHKAVIEVDEQGTTAAAASGAVAASRNKHVAIPFIADHPFQFYIVDRNTSTILFMGRVVNP